MQNDNIFLNQEEITRYSRHIILSEVGIKGQKKLKVAKVLVVGGGALSSPVVLYLAGAGVGTIGVVDFDRVEITNLQRQVVHSMQSIGMLKTESIKKRILDINPNINVLTFNQKLTSQNAIDILKDFDIVVDCTDNFPTRYLVNDACVILKKPNVYGSIFKFEGQASIFDAKKGPCYRCIFPTPPLPGTVPSCGESGVFGVLPGVIGSIQATEVIKLIVSQDSQTLIGRLLVYNAWKMKFNEFKISKDENCPICSSNPKITKLIDYDDFCGITEYEKFKVQDISAKELKKMIDDRVDVNIIDTREHSESNILHLENAMQIPLSQIGLTMDKIDSKKPTVVVCKVGTRSAYAIRMLKEAGFKGELYNLSGGILSWIENIDNSLPKY